MRAPSRRLNDPDTPSVFQGSLERDTRISRRKPTWVERTASDDPARSGFIDRLRARKRLVSGNDEVPRPACAGGATLADGPPKLLNCGKSK